MYIVRTFTNHLKNKTQNWFLSYILLLYCNEISSIVHQSVDWLNHIEYLIKPQKLSIANKGQVWIILAGRKNEYAGQVHWIELSDHTQNCGLLDILKGLKSIFWQFEYVH